MKRTVAFPVSPRPVAEKDLETWVNGEALKILRELREAANWLGEEKTEYVDTDGDGAWVAVWTSQEMPTNCMWQICARVVGISTSGAAQRYSYLRYASFQSTSGTVAQVGSTSTPSSHESALAGDIRFTSDATARTVSVEIRDDATSPTRWTAHISIAEALPE